MTQSDRHEIRRRQSITPFGVGAIVEISGESFVVCDIHYWGNKGERIADEPRLLQLLGVRELRSAPVKPDRGDPITDRAPGLPVMRFPTWMFCEDCHRMYRGSPKQAPTCPDCSLKGRTVFLAPMRFVVICSHGHLSDVDWVKWAHSGKTKRLPEEKDLVPEVKDGNQCQHRNSLEYIAIGHGTSLKSTFVRCRKCWKARNIDDLLEQKTSRDVIFCSGGQPWQSASARETCTAQTVQVVQRGATNVNFPAIMSAIDIPPNSDFRALDVNSSKVLNAPNYGSLRQLVASGDTSSRAFVRKLEDIAIDSELDEAYVLQVVESELVAGGLADSRPANPRDFRFQEYQALIAPDRPHHPRDRFIKHHAALSDYSPEHSTAYGAGIGKLKELLKDLVLITRLREVRAQVGFTRIKPRGEESIYDQLGAGFEQQPMDPVRLVFTDMALLPPASRWFPAIEIYGEGVFFSLNANAMSEWAAQPRLVKRVAEMERRREDNAPHLPSAADPAMILLHSVSHALIRQLVFDCGYSSAALRERIYCDPGRDMLGVLIYTADGDSEGTLGGLVRQGQPERFLPTFIKALQQARWCSSDPLCIESTGQGLLGLNLAACHACSLLPETSCEMNNSLLDRAVLVGPLSSTEFVGFFDPVLQPISGSLVI